MLWLIGYDEGQDSMPAPSAVEHDPLAVLEEVFQRLKIGELDHPDPSLLDKLPFKTSSPGKWPSWTDLDIASTTQGHPANRSEVIRAVHDLCSKMDQMFDRPAYQKTLGAKAIDLHRTTVSSVKKKLALFEDVLSPADPRPLLTALEETNTRLQKLDLNNPQLGLLDAFTFRSGKPGLFATWTDLDMSAQKTGSSSNRGAVIAALRDLLAKGEQMVARPACQRALGGAELEKYRAMMIAVSDKLALLGDTLSPPNPQPLLTMLEAVSQRFERTPGPNALDSFAFRPGKPGLFTVWTDLDLSEGKTGSSSNRGAVIMALDDLLVKFDRMLARPACQKTLGTPTIQKYGLMRTTVGEKLDRFKNPTPVAPPCAPRPAQEQERVAAVKRGFEDRCPIRRPTLFSQAAWMEAGAVAGSSMMVAMGISIFAHSFMRAIPLVGLMAMVVSFVRRQNQVSAARKRCAAAKGLYNNATMNQDIVNIFPLLTQEAQAQFLVGLGSAFRESIAERYPSLKNMCDQINTFLSCSPDGLERTNALTNIPKRGLGEEVVNALRQDV
jgi:hypothetical protein